ncbi:unnamed protein product, partial [Amoebophrya sp. A120]
QLRKTRSGANRAREKKQICAHRSARLAKHKQTVEQGFLLTSARYALRRIKAQKLGLLGPQSYKSSTGGEVSAKAGTARASTVDK